ncbi:MAG: hypothetical protein R3F62_26320 [Planctomycetota bacterium]
MNGREAPVKSGSLGLAHVAPQPLLDPLVHVGRETISYKRKLFHVLGIGCIGVTYGYSAAAPLLVLGILAVVTFIFSGLDILRFYVPSLKARVRRDFGPFMRNYELDRLSGSSWFLFAALITVALYSREAAALAFVYLAIGDPIASWVGVRWGRIKLPGGKSLEGSLSLFLSASVVGVAYLFGGIALGTLAPLALPALALLAIGGAAAAAFSEWLPLRGLDDNFVVPVITGGAITLLQLAI